LQTPFRGLAEAFGYDGSSPNSKLETRNAKKIPNPTAMTSTSPWLTRLSHVARDIKLAHSVFALPFAVLGLLLAAGSVQRRPSFSETGLVVLCMVLARTMAMTVNRWADARLDAANPRTQGRAVPGGQVSRPFMAGVALLCAALFVAAAALFWFIHHNPWPVILAPLVAAWLAGYSFTKRFTWLCHVFLGTALALSPVAAALAVHPPFLAQADVWLLAGMVTGWVAGFDVIYALQDVDFDRGAGLHSMPANLGVQPALWISRVLHAAALTCLIALQWISPQLGPLFGVGVVLVAGLLILEHALVWKSRTHHLNLAFFTVNGVISVLLGALGATDVVRSIPH
jgi:4-hydroxybenzoate polyprenyltransferase